MGRIGSESNNSSVGIVISNLWVSFDYLSGQLELCLVTGGLTLLMVAQAVADQMVPNKVD